MDEIWTEIIIKTPTGALERAEAALHMATPLGLYIEDYSDLETSVKAISGIDLIDSELVGKDRGAALLHVYFQPGLNRTECAAAVHASLERAGFTEVPQGAALFASAPNAAVYAVVSEGGVAEEDWANNWKRYFKPLRVGKGIMIIPEWEAQDLRGAPTPADVKAMVSIDPGMAFGTGSHATTKLCLELIEKCLDNFTKNAHLSADVLDLGCGSGILSIAAVLLGARSALGVDIDEYAVRNAAENARMNGVSDKTRFVTGNLLAGIGGQFDIIMVNIVADIVIRLLRDAGRFMRPGGAMILSGIIDEREADVAAEAEARGFFTEEALREEGWTALLLRRQTSHE